MFGEGTGSTSKTSSSPESGFRSRSNSVNVPSSNSVSPTVTRKRTSSGVFQIDEVEPPAKKDKETEKPKNNIVKTRFSENKDSSLDKIVIKDRRKEKELAKTRLENAKLDNGDKAKCVTAFKESDSWD